MSITIVLVPPQRTHAPRCLVASESPWPSTRRAARLAYRAACRHERRSTAKPRDAVRAPHGQVGPSPPTGAARGRARPCTPLCRRPTRLAASLRSEPLPSTAFRRPQRLQSRFSTVASRSRSLAGLFSTVAGRCKRFSSLSSAPFRPKTPRFRLQRLHTFLTNSRFHIIYPEFRRDFIETSLKYVQICRDLVSLDEVFAIFGRVH